MVLKSNPTALPNCLLGSDDAYFPKYDRAMAILQLHRLHRFMKRSKLSEPSVWIA